MVFTGKRLTITTTIPRKRETYTLLYITYSHEFLNFAHVKMSAFELLSWYEFYHLALANRKNYKYAC